VVLGAGLDGGDVGDCCRAEEGGFGRAAERLPGCTADQTEAGSEE